MPEHFHLLIGEPERGNISTVMQVLKQRFARRILRQQRARSSTAQSTFWGPSAERHVWQKRFYDFVVLSEAKKLEKLRYIHRNPVRRGLVLAPEQWRWSSFRHYAFGERAPVYVDQQTLSAVKNRSLGSSVEAFPSSSSPTLRKTRRVGQPQ